jgi:hypothetical protein
VLQHGGVSGGARPRLHQDQPVPSRQAGRRQVGLTNETRGGLKVLAMDQITIKTPNPKCRLFLKIDLERELAAGVYVSEAPWGGKAIV